MSGWQRIADNDEKFFASISKDPYTVVFDHRIPMTPSTWKRARSTGTRRFTDKKMQAAKNALGWEIKVAEPKLRCDAHACFGFRFTIFLGSSNGDGDNYEKLLMDALKGVVWEDDAQVLEGSWRKVINSPHPCLHLLIYRIS